jgi:phosphoglycolate phosphatase
MRAPLIRKALPAEPQPLVELVLVDLGNTLYDAVSSCVLPIYAMVKGASGMLGIDEQRLLDELGVVHQRHGKLFPFAILEASSVRARIGHLSPARQIAELDDAFHAFRRARRRSLRLYPGVRETLTTIDQAGVAVVAYADSNGLYSLHLLEELHLVGIIKRLYTPSDINDDWTPPRLKPTTKMAGTDFVRHLPPDDRKPNPKVVLDICADFGISASDSLYVGDSLIRDIWMAKQARARTAWAKYGTNYDKQLWPLFVRMTHWTDCDVQREMGLVRMAGDVVPDVALGSFSEILRHFRFGSGHESARVVGQPERECP